MLGLVLLYWIGKYFYKLAEAYNKSQWGFAILGVIVYYGGILLFSVLVGVISEFISPGFLETFNETLFSFLMFPFGLLSCYLLYIYLEKKWKKEDPRNNNLIDEIGTDANNTL